MVNYIKQVAGVLTEEATVATGGAPSANKVPQLDATGKLDATMMPPGIAAETQSIITSEALVAGNYVNIYNNAGTPTCRKADASNGRPANGFVLAAFGSAIQATVYLEGTNNAVTGQVAGPIFLGTAGAGSATAPSTSGYYSQKIGQATTATTVTFSEGPVIVLA